VINIVKAMIQVFNLRLEEVDEILDSPTLFRLYSELLEDKAKALSIPAFPDFGPMVSRKFTRLVFRE